MVLAALCLTSCDITVEDLRELHRRKHQTERKVLRVRVTPVDSLSNVSSTTYVGSVEESASVPMSFVAGGTVREVNVVNGQKVRAGQPLMSVDNTSAGAMLSTARATLRQAEDGYARVKRVYDAGGVSEVKLMEVRTQLEQARQAVAGLQKQVSDCRIYAPIDGVVCNLSVSRGQNLLPNQTALVVLNMNDLGVTVSVSENRIGKINIGDRALATFSALDGLRVPCTVVEKGIIANELTHSYDVRLRLDPDSALADSVLGNLLPGMVAKVNMLNQSSNGFVLPSHCVQNGQNETTVWVVTDGVAARRVITVGGFVEDNVFVTDGLRQGDLVVTAGYQKLYNGARVQI